MSKRRRKKKERAEESHRSGAGGFSVGDVRTEPPLRRPGHVDPVMGRSLTPSELEAVRQVSASRETVKSEPDPWVPDSERRCVDCLHYHRLNRQPIEGLCSAEPPGFVGEPLTPRSITERGLTSADFEFSVVDGMQAGCPAWELGPDKTDRRCGGCAFFGRFKSRPKEGRCCGCPSRCVVLGVGKSNLNQSHFVRPIVNERARCGRWKERMN